MSSRRSDEQVEVRANSLLRMTNYLWRRINHKLTSVMKMRNRIGKTTTLLFSLKGLDNLHQERKGQVNTIVMKQFNSILFHKSVNKQHTYQSFNRMLIILFIYQFYTFSSASLIISKFSKAVKIVFRVYAFALFFSAHFAVLHNNCRIVSAHDIYNVILLIFIV